MSVAPTRVRSLPKPPPHSIEAEQSLLGGLMLRNEVFFRLGDLRPADFFRTDHQIIFAGIVAMIGAGKACEFVTLTEHLRDAGKLEEAGGAQYLGALAADTYSVSTLVDYAEIVRERSMRRRVIVLCAEVGDVAYSGQSSEDLAGLLSAGVESLLKSSGAKSRKFAELLAPTEAYLKHAMARRQAGGCMGVGSGLPSLDRVIGGFYGPRVYGVAARPATGKTALLNQIAFNAAARGEPGLVMSLEMGAEELMIRALSAHSKRNVTRLFHGHAEDADVAMKTAAQMGDLPLWLDTETYGLNAILAQIAMHKHRHGIKWAAIDHVGLIETEKFNSRNDQIGHITRKLKQCAKQLQVPIIALFQLSRLSEKENRQPGLHDLRDSGNIEQDLDVALFLHVDQKDRDKPVKTVKLGVLKNRNGRASWLSEPFEFDGAVQTFREIATQYAAAPSRYEPGVDL